MDQFREAMRYWLSNNWDLSITVGEWWDRLAGSGLAVPTWNRSHGGLAATAQVQQVVEAELAAAGTIAPPLWGDGVRVVGPALRQFATPEQFAEILPALLTGQQLWTVLLYEPGSDDLMAPTCRAEFDWKYLTVTGTKVCTDHTATHAVLLARSGEPGTGPNGGRRGLTCLLVEIGDQPFDAATGGLTFDGARMLHDRVLGTRDEGWPVVKGMLPYLERSLAGRIRRGLVNVEPGAAAGNLDRTVGDVLAAHRPQDPPPAERRSR